MTEVADLDGGSSPQPRRVSVRARIAQVLEQAEREKSGLPRGFTHYELASAVYATDEPTPTQESAVRRAVAAFVAAGQAERETVDRRLHPRRPGWHWRRSRYGETVYPCRNPAGIIVRRATTDEDREARAQVAERNGYHDYAARIRTGETS